MQPAASCRGRTATGTCTWGWVELQPVGAAGAGTSMVASWNGRSVLLQPGIPELEPVPPAASTGESLRAVEKGGGLRGDLFAATGHRFAGTDIGFSCHRPSDLLEPDAPSPPLTEFILKPVSLFGWTRRCKPTTAASRRRG